MKFLFLVVKIVLSVALILFFISKVDIHAVEKIIGTTNGIKALIVGTVICLLQTCLGGARLPHILKLYGHMLSTLTSIRICLIGSFFSQTMISFVGGDAIRVLCLKKRTAISTKTATSAILLDRVIGFVALILLFLIVMSPLLDVLVSTTMRYGVISLALASTIGVIVFFLLGIIPLPLNRGKWLSLIFDLCSNSRYLFLSLEDAVWAFLLSLGLQLLNVCAIYGIFHIYGVDISFLMCLVLANPAMLISMLPISIAGWGVRESVMVMGFSLLGIPADTILAVSITFGITVFLGGLPGMFFFLFDRKRVYSNAKSLTTG
jgi:uncharacterized membrane protein YbhN (UPF0104 family)